MKVILIIEDNTDIRENTAELLELSGYRVITASNGELGISLAKAHLPDIVLSDVLMPVLNGHQVFEELKKYPATAQIPFFFLTSSVEPKDVKYALDRGATGYIKKPFEEHELLDAIKRSLI